MYTTSRGEKDVQQRKPYKNTQTQAIHMVKGNLDKALLCETHCDQMSSNELTNITQHGRAIKFNE